jgi:hypothetical protein
MGPRICFVHLVVFLIQINLIHKKSFPSTSQQLKMEGKILLNSPLQQVTFKCVNKRVSRCEPKWCRIFFFLFSYYKKTLISLVFAFNALS